MYQFQFRAPSVEAAMAEATRRVDREVESQPEHQHDRQLALNHLQQVLNLFAPAVTDRHELLVSMNSNINGQTVDGKFMANNAGTGCAVGLLTLPPPPAPPPSTDLPAPDAPPAP